LEGAGYRAMYVPRFPHMYAERELEEKRKGEGDGDGEREREEEGARERRMERKRETRLEPIGFTIERLIPTFFHALRGVLLGEGLRQHLKAHGRDTC